VTLILLFLQELLLALSQVANKYKVSISNVAVRYIADMPAVAAVIVGARLSISEHIASNQAAYSFPGVLKLSVDVLIRVL
jgi:aryl-alcohol dehydrogenase-like predicted oxidoreductase